MPSVIKVDCDNLFCIRSLLLTYNCDLISISLLFARHKMVRLAHYVLENVFNQNDTKRGFGCFRIVCIIL